MLVSDLISFFSDFTRLPVRIDDVVDHMVDHGVRDRITLIPVDIDTAILRGFLFQHEQLRAYGEPLECADIYFGIDQEPEWQRLVCCKELLHILDNEAQASASRAEVSRLIQEIVLPPTLQNLATNGP
jgi:hypothetical protein